MADGPTERPRDPAGVKPAGGPEPSTLATIVSGAVLVAALHLGREVFIPIVLAVLLSFVIGPAVTLLRRIGLHRVPATIASVVVALGIIAGLGVLIGSQVADLASDLPQYRATIGKKVEAVQSGVGARLSGVIRDFNREMATVAQNAPANDGAPNAAGPAPREAIPVEIREPARTPAQLLKEYVGTVLGPFETAAIVLVVVVFILLQREDLRDRMIRLFGATDLHRTTAAMDDAAARLSRYFLMQLALNATFGIIIGTGLFFIGVPNPILWGILAALMRFVPYIGAFLAGLLPVLLAAAVDPGWGMVVMTLALFLVSEPIMGQVVEPLVYGHSTGLSPFAVVVSAIFWTWLWGPIGLILSTPLTVCLVVLGRHVERLEFLDVLFGDRPALTPVESFYQRMLAGDPDEAQEHAEELLQTCPLAAYYDEVALKGLQLAANDALRGVLTDEQIARVKESITGLVDDLSNYGEATPGAANADEDTAGDKAAPKRAKSYVPEPEADPPPEAWRLPRSVLCVAGRGPLDEAAATMLTQLLRKRGFGAEVVPHRAVARSNVLSLGVDGVRMVCISYLDISGNPAHLRYLLRRLRQKLQNAPILVGLWPSSDPILTDEKLRGSVGADYYVASLRDAVQACVEAASTKKDQPAGERPVAPEASPVSLALVPAAPR